MIWKANGNLKYIKKCGCRLMDILLSFCSILVRPYSEYCVHLWAPHFKNEGELWKRVQRSAMMIRGLECLFYEKRLTDLGLFSLVEKTEKGSYKSI